MFRLVKSALWCIVWIASLVVCASWWSSLQFVFQCLQKPVSRLHNCPHFAYDASLLRALIFASELSQWWIQGGGDRPPPLKVGKIDLIQEEHVSTHVSQSESGSLTDLSCSEPVVV